MKNLAHLPIEKLELSPSRVGVRWYRRDPGPPAKNWHRDDRRHYRDGAWLELYYRLTRIIAGSVGKNWDEVYSRLREQMVGIKFNFNFDYQVYNKVSKPFWSYRFQQWEVHEHNRYGSVTPLVEYIRNIRYDKYWYRDEFYYICPKSNMLRLVRTKPKLTRADSNHFRQYYHNLTNARKERKARKQAYTNVLAMINDPELYKFYKELYSKRKFMKDRIAYWEKTKDTIDKHRWMYRPDRSYYVEIPKLEHQIAQLEAGNFDTFFESAVYLYSRQKECHHFETP